MLETRTLASFVVDTRLGDIPADVVREARRAIVNIVGCMLGGCREEATDLSIRALSPFFGPPTAVAVGREERMDPLHAALLNGIASHVHDFDDTTPGNYGHPSSPVASALLAFAAANPIAGNAFVEAFILGFEAECRVANAVYPAHYDAGWHMTGTAGVFGAAAAIGKVMGLTTPEMVWALGLGATQAAGLREMFGSMGKAFHPGRSAQSGYVAAVLAKTGFSAGERGIEGPRGFAAVAASASDLSRITDRLGEHYDLRVNTYKPFPCGIVNHPTIDGCIQLHDQHHLRAGDIAAVRLRVAPLVLDLCNQQQITRGLQGKFSVYHGAAIGLVRGRAGLQEYTDEAVNDPDVAQVRARTTAVGDRAVTEDQAGIEVELGDGRVLQMFVEQSLGNLRRPLSDAQLNDKFRRQGVLVLPEDQVETVLDLCWRAGELTDAGDIVRASVPRRQSVQR